MFVEGPASDQVIVIVISQKAQATKLNWSSRSFFRVQSHKVKTNIASKLPYDLVEPYQFITASGTASRNLPSWELSHIPSQPALLKMILEFPFFQDGIC